MIRENLELSMLDNATFVLQILWGPAETFMLEKLELAQTIVFLMESQKEMVKKERRRW